MKLKKKHVTSEYIKRIGLLKLVYDNRPLFIYK